MAIKVDLEIDQAAFNAFSDKFKEYEKALKEIPAAWMKAHEQAEKMRKSLQGQTEAVKEQAGIMDNLVHGVERFFHVSTQTSHSWTTLARNTRSAAGSITEATGALMKWAGLTSLISGVMAGGALFGLDRLAESVSGQRTTALATGSTIGKGRSADIAYGRFVGSGFGGRIANMIHDPEQAHWIESILGRQLKGDEDPNDLIGEVLQKSSAQAKRDGKEKYMQDPVLGAVFGKGEQTTLFGANDNEIGEARNKYSEYATGNKFETQDAKAWQDFLRTLEETKRTIETSFINRLTQITPEVDKLVQSFKNLALKVINSDAFSEAIKFLDDGIRKLGEELNDPDFTKHMMDLIHGAGKLAEGIGWLVDALSKVAHFFGIDAGGGSSGPTGSSRPGGSGSGTDSATGRGSQGGNTSPGSSSVIGPGSGAMGNVPATAPSGSLGSNWTNSQGLTPAANPTGSNMPSSGGNLTELITASANKYGVDPRVMEGIRAGESGHGANYDRKVDSLESSYGPFQLNRKRGLGVDFERETGKDLTDSSTIPDQADWVAKYLKRHGTNGQWMGYHGPRDADSRWGDSGYKPSMPAGSVPAPRKVQTTKEKPRVDNNPRVNNNQSEVTINKNVGGNPVNTINSVANQQ
jgi:hypothetical protein